MPDQEPPPFPDATLPALYADFVFNAQAGPFMVKWYLGRADPTLDNSPGAKFQPVAQVVMPIASFVNTAVFFDAVLEDMVRDGFVSAKQVAEMRKALTDRNDAPTT